MAEAETKREVTYAEWCRHYGYDPDSQQAREDWRRYYAERDAVRAIFAGES